MHFVTFLIFYRIFIQVLDHNPLVPLLLRQQANSETLKSVRRVFKMISIFSILFNCKAISVAVHGRRSSSNARFDFLFLVLCDEIGENYFDKNMGLGGFFKVIV